MSSKQTIPVWVEPVDLPGWPTQPVESATLRYRIPLPAGWSVEPQVEETPVEVQHVFRGDYPAEWLIANFMKDANPKDKITNWVEAIMHMAGFPILPMKQAIGPSLQLLEWRYEGAGPLYAQRLAVDEAYFYSGLAMFQDQSRSALARFYILLARRENSAWKIALSFMSACPPGMPEAMVISNDHVRAGATFGSVRFL